MELRLADKVAIVTGAGRGVGEAIARTLAAAGARVAVNDVNPDRAERVAAAIQAEGGLAVAIAADVANKFQCVHLVETTRDHWNRLDILVNNASVRPAGSILKLDEWEWNRCLEVNLKSTFLMSQLCGRVMADENIGDENIGDENIGDENTGDENIGDENTGDENIGDEDKERGGVIVNVASTAGVETALPGAAAYCASQAGIVGFARECAREFAGYSIRVNTILRPDNTQAVASLVLFLCSEAGRHINGSVITT